MRGKSACKGSGRVERILSGTKSKIEDGSDTRTDLAHVMTVSDFRYTIGGVHGWEATFVLLCVTLSVSVLCIVVSVLGPFGPFSFGFKAKTRRFEACFGSSERYLVTLDLGVRGADGYASSRESCFAQLRPNAGRMSENGGHHANQRRKNWP